MLNDEIAMLESLTDFALRHKDDEYAAMVVMSALRGECEHYGYPECEICGHCEE
jgi:hypothetical protein